MKKIFIIISLAFSITFMFAFRPYNYSFYGETINSTPGMVFSTYMDSRTLGVSLSSPEDVSYYDEKIYLLDGGSDSKLVIINELHEVDKVYEEFDFASEFESKKIELDNTLDEDIKPKILSTKIKRAKSIDINQFGVYIADTDNERIVKLNFDFEIVDIFYQKETIIEEISFKPISITVDSSERIYLVIDGVHEGIIELSKDGDFNRFVGTNKITLSPFDILKRSLMTETQKEKLLLELSTSYISVNINEEGFIYSTANPTKNNNENMVQLINPKGVDVLKRNGYHAPMGDVNFLASAALHPQGDSKEVGPSRLVDIDYTKYGIYSVLDQRRARIFTYDQEGNLLYVNGVKSSGNTQNDKIQQPVALAYMNDDIIVVDNSNSSKKIVIYTLTDFGQKVNKAIEYHYNGMFEEASVLWEEVLKINTNYEIAYNGIGKSQLRNKEFKKAMKNFKLGHDKYYYSKAFKGYRNDLIKKYFSATVLSVFGLVVVYNGYKIYNKRRLKNEK